VQPPIDQGREIFDGRVHHQEGEEALIHWPCRAFDGMGGPTSKKFHGLGKTGQGSLRCQGHANGRSHAAGDSQELQNTQASPPAQVPQKGFGNNAHG
jgi:hypothetical protein